jgi:hypothetical protein
LGGGDSSASGMTMSMRAGSFVIFASLIRVAGLDCVWFGRFKFQTKER